MSKEEILAALNLGTGDTGIGVGKHGSDSRVGLAKDLVEAMEKDLEKLKRQAENIQTRKTLATKGGVIDDTTEEERERELAEQMQRDLTGLGTHVIHASPRRFQVMRH